jgi:hypothetical protein
MSVASEMKLSNMISSPRHVSLVPGPNISWTSTGGMPDPPLPRGDGLGGARGDTGGGARAWLASYRWARPVSRNRQDPCVSVGRINAEHATEAERLSQLVVEISNALVELGMLPIQDIPQLPKLV